MKKMLIDFYKTLLIHVSRLVFFTGLLSFVCTSELSAEPCGEFLNDLQFNDLKTGQPVQMGAVTPEAVTGFELLYATPGTGDASEIAGHLVLRVMLDNRLKGPDNESVNPNDLVISFLADTNEVQRTGGTSSAKNLPAIQKECKKNWLNLVQNSPHDEKPFDSVFQSLKGLSGGFDAVMERHTLAWTVKNYTIEQDRNLLRYELVLTDDQKADLIEHLCRIKNTYKPKYYFFNRNCASILVNVIAQGIHDKEIEAFDPLVSPPNTLIGLFIRKGLARPVYPSFYSYRYKGFIAQRLLTKAYQALAGKYPDMLWAKAAFLLSNYEDDRHFMVTHLGAVFEQKPETAKDIYRLLSLIQEAEMVFSHKDIDCEDYTSIVTAEARSLQKKILKRTTQWDQGFHIDVNNAIERFWQHTEARSKGDNFYTGHYEWSLGPGYLNYGNGKSFSGVQLNTALHHQAMGDRSGIAMQRSGHIEFGKLAFLLAGETDTPHYKLEQWHVTGLKLRKFRERLNQVPSFFEPGGRIGLGLTVADVYGSNYEKKISGTIIGGEVLTSLLSSHGNTDYLYMSVGASGGYEHHKAVTHLDKAARNGFVIRLPLRLESLMTVSFPDGTQLRNELEYNISTNPDFSDLLKGTTSASIHLGEIRQKATSLIAEFNYERTFKSNYQKSVSDSFAGRIMVEVRSF